ncbi:MAG: signal peptidase I [Bryobacteraceae bacterium]
MEPDNSTTGVPSAEGPVVMPEPSVAQAVDHKRSPVLATISWLRDLFLSVLIAIVVILFLYQPVKVEGTSMMPALVDQERIFINKFAYKFGITEINRGDTVVFWFPGDPSKSYIKRVIGVPGDTVEVVEGTVFVNEKKIDEPYVPDDYRDKMSTPKNHVPDGEYFVLGDHRSSSNDSRSWGTVPRSYIYGRAVFVYWPPERMGMLQ